MPAKSVPIIASLRYGFRESKKHVLQLIPLSILFFLPNLSAAWFSRPWNWLAADCYKAALFFVVLFRALSLTQKAREYGGRGQRAKKARFFAAGELIKWGLQALAVGASLAMLGL